jgi:hypothetical protein
VETALRDARFEQVTVSLIENGEIRRKVNVDSIESSAKRRNCLFERRAFRFVNIFPVPDVEQSTEMAAVFFSIK